MLELMMQSLGVTTDDVEGLKKFVHVLNTLPPEIQFIKQQGETAMEEIEKLKSELAEVKKELTDITLAIIKLTAAIEKLASK